MCQFSFVRRQTTVATLTLEQLSDILNRATTGVVQQVLEAVGHYGSAKRLKVKDFEGISKFDGTESKPIRVRLQDAHAQR